MKNILKEELGITLVALIITIILMLILAGVAISILTTDGGLFDKTKIAVEKYNNAVQAQDEKIATLTNEMNKYFNKYSNGGSSVGEGELTDEELIVKRYSSGFELTVPDSLNGIKYKYYINGKCYETEEKLLEIYSLEPNTSYNVYVEVVEENGNILRTASKSIKTKPGKFLYKDGNEYDEEFVVYRESNASVTLNREETTLSVTYSCGIQNKWEGGIKKSLNINNTVSYYNKLYVYVESSTASGLLVGIGTVSGGDATATKSVNITGKGLYEIDLSDVTEIEDVIIHFALVGSGNIEISKMWIEGVDELIEENVNEEVIIENIEMSSFQIIVPETLRDENEGALYSYYLGDNLVSRSNEPTYTFEGALLPEYDVYVKVINGDFEVKTTKVKTISLYEAEYIYNEGNLYGHTFNKFNERYATVTLMTEENRIGYTRTVSNSSREYYGGIYTSLNIDNSNGYYKRLYVEIESSNCTSLSTGIGSVSNYVTENLAYFKPNNVPGVYEIDISALTNITNFYLQSSSNTSDTVYISKVWLRHE